MQPALLERHLDDYLTPFGKLHGVSHQVDQYLLNFGGVAHEIGRQ